MLMTQPTIIGAALVILVAAGAMPDYVFWGWVSIPTALTLLALILWRVKLSLAPSHRLLKAIATCAISICALVFVWSFMQWASWYK